MTSLTPQQLKTLVLIKRLKVEILQLSLSAQQLQTHNSAKTILSANMLSEVQSKLPLQTL
jgi:hypothetical protein